MRYLIVGLVLLLLSIYLGIEISQTHNTVLFVFNDWLVEASLWVVFLGLLISFIAFYFLFRLIGRALGFSKDLQQWKKTRRNKKARQLTHQGLCELAEGHWEKAEEILVKAARNNSHPLIDYLAAAKAAQAQYAFDRRDTYLRRAHHSDKGATVAIGLAQAELQLEGNQWEQALATLQHLQQQTPNHGYVIKLLTKVYVELKEWAQCQKLLTPLKKSKAITQKDFFALARKVYLSLLTESIEKETTILEATWKTLPKDYQRDSEFIYIYCEGLLHWQQDDKAAHLIVSYQKHNWSSQLTTLFSKLRYENTVKQLEIAEHWHQKHPHDPALLIALGELCIRERLWGKARDYLVQGLSTEPSLLGYIKLSSVYESLGESEKAQYCLQKMAKYCETTAITSER